ncbi:MAG: hypothetical protein KJ646_04790 [Nanoarchaeota archaeon]|nr:hypothetical protein [Nanoarchaeota archaeon]
MPNPTIHPNGDIANFVNNYESRIKPYLNRGKIPEGIRSIVMEHHMRYEIMDNLPIKPNGAAKAYHRLALNFLLELTEGLGKCSQNLFDYVTERIDTQVKNLDAILADDSHYKSIRKELK